MAALRQFCDGKITCYVTRIARDIAVDILYIGTPSLAPQPWEVWIKHGIMIILYYTWKGITEKKSVDHG